MKKLLILITSFSLIGCGVVKKDKQSTEVKTKSDLNGSKTDYKRFRDSSFILRPFDASKPMLIGKDTIVNVMIENHYRDRWHIQKDTIEKKETQVIEIDSKQKKTDNTAIYDKFMWLIIILFVIALGYYHFAKAKKAY